LKIQHHTPFRFSFLIQLYFVVVHLFLSQYDHIMYTLQETFYLAVPYLSDEDEIGELVFYLEEPAGRINKNGSEFGKQFSKATEFLRGIKKKASAFYRNVAKKWGAVLRVACNESSMIIKISDFDGVGTGASVTDKYNLQTTISLIGMNHGGDRSKQDNTATATTAKSLAANATAKSLAANADWVRHINIFYGTNTLRRCSHTSYMYWFSFNIRTLISHKIIIFLLLLLFYLIGSLPETSSRSSKSSRR
jgi:hypothetical protein